jgi:hypothetical protein
MIHPICVSSWWMNLVKNNSTKVWNASVFHFNFVLFSLKQLKEWTRVKSLSHVDEWQVLLSVPTTGIHFFILQNLNHKYIYIMKSAFFIFSVFLITQGMVFAQTESTPKSIQKGNFTLSAGYGVPSILRAYLKYNTSRTEYTVKGWGPYMLKLDYMLNNRFSIGLNATYSFSRLSWMDGGWDTSIHAIRPYEYGIEAEEISVSLRGNYHFLVRKKIDAYAGLGFGYGRFSLGTYTEAPVNQFSVAYDFPKPLAVEATVGMRYYIRPWIGLYTEFGLGKSWILFRKKFLPESLIQFGLNFKI